MGPPVWEKYMMYNIREPHPAEAARAPPPARWTRLAGPKRHTQAETPGALSSYRAHQSLARIGTAHVFQLFGVDRYPARPRIEVRPLVASRILKDVFNLENRGPHVIPSSNEGESEMGRKMEFRVVKQINQLPTMLATSQQGGYNV